MQNIIITIPTIIRHKLFKCTRPFMSDIDPLSTAFLRLLNNDDPMRNGAPPMIPDGNP